jgi:hypothetical protein
MLATPNLRLVDGEGTVFFQTADGEEKNPNSAARTPLSRYGIGGRELPIFTPAFSSGGSWSAL